MHRGSSSLQYGAFSESLAKNKWILHVLGAGKVWLYATVSKYQSRSGSSFYTLNGKLINILIRVLNSLLKQDKTRLNNTPLNICTLQTSVLQ